VSLSSEEKALAALWAEALRLPASTLRPDSSFFAMGGHSLLLTQLASRIRTEMHAEVSLAKLYASPTLSGMAALVREATPAAYRRIERVNPRPQHIPLSFAQQRLWFID
jgi:aryl carrier-like protein